MGGKATDSVVAIHLNATAIHRPLPKQTPMILVFVPYHSKKRYVVGHLLDWVEKADLTDCEVIMRWHRGPWGEQDAIKHQREFARKLATERNATHLYFMDADTIPPLDAIPRFLAHRVPIIGGLYHSRAEGSETRIVAWRQNDDQQTFQHEPSPVEVDGMGMGCVLLAREAFTSFSFTDWVNSDDDYPAYDALRANGYKILLDTSIVCKHYETTDKYN